MDQFEMFDAEGETLTGAPADAAGGAEASSLAEVNGPLPKALPIDPSPAILVDRLTKRYGDTKAVSDVSFSVPRGKTVGLLICGIVLRNGLGAESLAYSVMIVLLPLSCVYYPVTILPAWMQPAAWILPTTYVFEGLRGILLDHAFRGDLMLACVALNLVYLLLGFAAFLLLLRSARHNGALHAMGE